jgi:ABC-type polysaccharide/polyol phosphate export permease
LLSKPIRLAGLLGWQDVRQAYRRSAIGPFWITAGMAVQIATMGVVFGIIFKTPLQEYLPFLATSIILWSLMASIITDGCMSFISAESIIKQLKLPTYIHIFRTVWKQLITLGHNIVILPFVFIAFWHPLSWSLALFIPGLVLVVLNVTWMAYLLAMLSTRYRDIPQVIASVMTIFYFISPVMWQPSLIPSGTAHLLLGLNPMYHLLQIMRLPILGQLPTIENWALAIILAVVGWAGVFFAVRKFRNQIAYWV